MNSIILIGLTMLLTTASAFPQNSEYTTDFSNYERTKQIDYTFRYFVDKPSSKLIFDHYEQRVGNYLTGRYALLEPNGLVRTVYYQVDNDKGFVAHIKVVTPGSMQQQTLYHINQPKVPFVHQKPVAFISNRQQF